MNNDEMTSFDDSVSLLKVGGMYKDWFLEYASYVILERAIHKYSDG